MTMLCCERLVTLFCSSQDRTKAYLPRGDNHKAWLCQLFALICKQQQQTEDDIPDLEQADDSDDALSARFSKWQWDWLIHEQEYEWQLTATAD